MSDGNQGKALLDDLPSTSSPHVIATEEEVQVQVRASAAAGSSPTALSPTATLGHSSPELPSLPELPPLGGYPAASTTGASKDDTSYFTASWGSPYQNPPPRSIAANIGRVAEEGSLASSDIDEDSPDARFGLSHLVPSRLPTISRLAPTRPSTPSPGSPPQSPTRLAYFASSAQSIKQFFTSPKRPSVDLDRRGSNRGSGSAWNLRSGWWNNTPEESGKAKKEHEQDREFEFVSSPPSGAAIEDELRNVDPFQLDGTADTLARTNQLRAKGHKSRDSNLTLTQDDFWPTFNLADALKRTNIMQASRYANPEPPAPAAAAATAEPPSPPPKDTPRKVDAIDTELARATSSEDPLALPNSAVPKEADRITPPAQLQRTESALSASSGRIKRTVKYRGKNVHINIPARTSGTLPLSREEADARIQEFEDAGYDTRGFDNWGDNDVFGRSSRYQNREIHPDPADDIAAQRSKAYKVFVPNKALWDEYMAFLREEKLRLLGVSLGGGSDAVESPATISRQGSSAQLFSPPIPTSSAGSNRHAQRASVFQFPTPGHMSRGSIASPVGAFGHGHMHRQSMFSPPTLGLQGMQGMTPPVLQSLSPQLLEALARGSPGPEVQDRRSPLSPYGMSPGPQPNLNGSQQGGFPFSQRNELLIQMQRQKEQQIAAEMQRAAAMQQMMAAAAQQQAQQRPKSTLQEVPEDEAEEDDEFGRPQLRSRQGEGPEIVNPKPSHRHNISVKLEQGIHNNSDYHLEKSIDKEMDEDAEEEAKAEAEEEQKPELPPRTTSLRNNNSQSQQHSQANGGVLAPSSAMSAKQQIFGAPPAAAAEKAKPESRNEEDVENVAPSFGKASGAEAANPWANDPTFFEKKPKPTSISRPAHLSHHSSKSSVSGLNVAAKEFNPSSFVPSGNPSASFNPGIFSASAFSFTPANKKVEGRNANGRKSVSPSPQAFKSSFGGAGGLSAAAKEFNPMASSFSPQASAFSPQASSFSPQASSFSPGGFAGFGNSTTSNPFSPGSKSEFSFTSAAPTSAPVLKKSVGTASAEHSDAPSSAGPKQSIFGKIDTSAEGKKAKKSKAIPIVHPDSVEESRTAGTNTPASAELEDEFGRLAQSDERMKRVKKWDSDGEREPLFAPIPEGVARSVPAVVPQQQQRAISPVSAPPVPELKAEPAIAPAPVTLKSNATAEDVKAAVEEENKVIDELADSEADAEVALEDQDQEQSELPAQFSFVTETGKDEVERDEDKIKASPASPASSTQELAASKELGSSTKDTQSGSTSRVFSNSSTLSAAAAPFEFKAPSFVIDEGLKNKMASHLHAASRDSMKESQVVDAEPASPARSASSLSKTANDEVSEQELSDRRERLPSSVRYFDDDVVDQTSFQDIDAIMQHMNEQGSDGGIERDEPSWPNSSSPQFDVSPLPSSPAPHIFQMPIRSDAPSPSPRRPMITKTLNVDSASVTQDPFSDGRAVPGYDSPVRRLGDSGELPVSDWDDVVSSGQENEFRQKAEFFGPHVSSVIETAMDRHFLAMEKKFNDMLDAQQGRRSSRRARSRITVDSDADDEDDDVETDAYSRGFSPKRDRKMEKIRAMILESLAAQRPRTPPPASAQAPAPVQDSSHFENLHKAIADMRGEMVVKSDAPAPVMAPAGPTLEEMRAMIEESVALQNEALIKRREEATRAEDEERFHEFADRLKDAATRIASETEARSEAEHREAETNRLLKLTEEELELLKEVDRENTSKLRAFEQAAEVSRAAESGKDDAQADLSKKLMDLAMENDQLKETLDEYRLSSDKWRREIEEANVEREKVHGAFGALKVQAEEALRIRETMRGRIEKLTDDVGNAVGQVAAERAKWQRADAEHRTRYEILAARAEAEARTRERFEREIERFEAVERESFKTRAAYEHEKKENVKLDQECERLVNNLKETSTLKMDLVQTQKENQRLEELVEQLKTEAIEHQKMADQYAREFREAREAGRLEVDRTRGLMQIDIETANNEVNIVRADMEAEMARLRTELDNAKLENDTLKAKHELDLEEAADAKRSVLQQLNEDKDMVIKDLRDTFEERLEGLRKQHRRDLDHTIENKNQSEAFLRDAHAQVLQDLQDHHERTLEQALNEKEFSEGQLNERLSLADSKIEHLTDKVQHLEEKLEMAKSAAAAAAQAARSSVKSPIQTHAPTFPAPIQAAVAAAAPTHPRLPEKISPQALRESIAVLQEQLQERELKIETLESEVAELDKDAPAKLKAKDTEISWLRELIGVRVDDLSELVSILDRPTFNREAVRNAAIRIRASIQMEQDAKERREDPNAAAGSVTASLPSLAQIQSFASPKAAQLAAAIGNWRRGGGGIAPSGLRAGSVTSESSERTQTPSKPPPRPQTTTAQSFLNGLMTPPASNLRKTPSPDPSMSSRLGLGAPNARPLSGAAATAGAPRPLGAPRALGTGIGKQPRRFSRESETSAGPSTPPFLKDAEYDDDAEESNAGYYDDEEEDEDEEDGNTIEQEGTPRAERIGALEAFEER